LSHPARIAIVEYLLKVNSCVCGDVVDELPLAQPTISQHLKELKSAGIIKGSIAGNSICYCLNIETLEQIQSFFKQIIDSIEINKNNCC
jgi:ArsR family transcriptional regulator